MTLNLMENITSKFMELSWGEKSAPADANLYMSSWEESAVLKCNHLSRKYFRFLYDTFGVWSHSEEFGHFLEVLNSHHEYIKITQSTKGENRIFRHKKFFFSFLKRIS